ncbi:MAG: sugar ABC transporter substrate-binding protein [Eubacteriales bacterium]|nr:sugar ABC transporter substrate-binding protein [Eubacteriales bacterium]
MIKRLMAILIAAILMISICTLSLAEEKIELTYCYWGAAAEAQVREEVVQMFNASQDKIVVKPIFIEGGTYLAKLQAYFAAGEAPDIIQSSGDFGDTYISKGMIEDLTPYIERDALTDAWDSILLDAYTYDGKVYAAPMIFNSFYLIYNKTLFDKAGVPYPTDDWTESDFLDAAQKLTSGEGVEKTYGVRLSWLPTTLLADMYGTSIFEESAMKLHVSDNQAFIDSFQFLTDLALKYGVAPDAAGEKAAGSGFVSGRFGMEVSAMWDMDQIVKTVGDSFEFDIAKFPISETYGRWRTPIANIGYYMFSGSKQKEAAWEFIKYASTDQEAQKVMNLAGIPASKAVVTAPDFANTYPEGWPTLNKSIVQSMDSAVLWPTSTGVWQKLLTELTNQYDLVMNGKVTVEQAVQDLQRVGDGILLKNK